jgi:hypothetical protein
VLAAVALGACNGARSGRPQCSQLWLLVLAGVALSARSSGFWCSQWSPSVFAAVTRGRARIVASVFAAVACGARNSRPQFSQQWLVVLAKVALTARSNGSWCSQRSPSVLAARQQWLLVLARVALVLAAVAHGARSGRPQRWQQWPVVITMVASVLAAVARGARVVTLGARSSGYITLSLRSQGPPRGTLLAPVMDLTLASCIGRPQNDPYLFGSF